MGTKPSSIGHPFPIDETPRMERTGALRTAADSVVEERGCEMPDGGGGPHDSATESSPGATASDPLDRGDRRQRLRTTLDLVRSNPTGRIALKVCVAVAGALVVALGAVLIPLPGPGWLLVIGGLGIWAIEFNWARRLLTFTRRNVRGWTRWVGRQSWPIRIVIGSIGVAFVSMVVWLSLKYSLGIDLVADALAYLATH